MEQAKLVLICFLLHGVMSGRIIFPGKQMQFISHRSVADDHVTGKIALIFGSRVSKFSTRKPKF